MTVKYYDWAEYQANFRPNKVAIKEVSSGRITSYKELNERSKSLASWLQKKGLNKAFIEENLEARDSFYKKDDFIDACSLFWSASRVALNKEIRIPDKIFTDADGIIMQIRV